MNRSKPDMMYIEERKSMPDLNLPADLQGARSVNFELSFNAQNL